MAINLEPPSQWPLGLARTKLVRATAFIVVLLLSVQLLSACACLCPAAQQCVGKCCAKGEACSGGKCVSGSSGPIDGTWTGSFSTGGAVPIAIRFVLKENQGILSGQMYIEDPKTHELLPDADLTGNRAGARASWSTTTDLTFHGEFQGNEFAGTITFPADEVSGAFDAQMKLTRDK